VTQTLFNGFRTANSVRVAELRCSRREALRNVGQGVLLDAVTGLHQRAGEPVAVAAQRSNVAFLRETLSVTQRRLNAGDVTQPTPRKPRRASTAPCRLTPPKSRSR